MNRVSERVPSAQGFMVMLSAEELAGLISSQLTKSLSKLVSELAERRASEAGERVRVPVVERRELSTVEAMSRLGVSNRRTFFRVVERLGIPHVRLSSKIFRFYEDDIEQVLRRARRTKKGVLK